MNFRLPSGASYGGRDGSGNETFSVEIPLDEHGFFGRECPGCNQYFKVFHSDYLALPDDLKLYCVYCGLYRDHNEFMTEQQTARIMSLARDVALQTVSRGLDQAFGRLNRSSGRHGGVSFKYRSKPFYPSPLPGINEEGLIRERACGSCGMRYGVYGEHRYCPVCGPLSPIETSRDALAAERARLDLVDGLERDAAAAMREQGVLDRIYGDTIENVVGIVETLSERVFRHRVDGADLILRGRGNVFQRLNDLSSLFQQHLGVDLPGQVSQWDDLVQIWAARHVLMHNDGFIDERYLTAVPRSPYVAGQRLVVDRGRARAAIESVTELVDAIGAADSDQP